MTRRNERVGEYRRGSRPALPERRGVELDEESGTNHAQLVEALRAIDGLVDVTGGSDERPNLHLRHKPFLHFHVDRESGGIYADVKFGSGPASDFEPVWASTPAEREALLNQVRKHVRRATRR